MERSEEILKILNTLNSNTEKGTKIYQSILDFNIKESSETKKKVNGFSSQLDTIIKGINKDDTVKRNSLLDKITTSVSNLPTLLTDIKASIDRGSVIQAAMLAATAGQASSISSIKSLANQKADSQINKFDSILKNINNKSSSKDKSSGEKIPVGDAIKASKSFKAFLPFFRGLGGFVLDLTKALVRYSKIAGQVDVEKFTFSIVNMVEKIGGLQIKRFSLTKIRPDKFLMLIVNAVLYFIKKITKMSKSEVKKFSIITEGISKTLTKLIDSLSNMVNNKNKFGIALEVFGLIAKVIRKMQWSFLFAALLFPVLPFAMFSFARIFQVANSIGYFGLPFVRGIMAKGAMTLDTMSMAILKMTLSFWFLGRIMRKYDVPNIVLTIFAMFNLFEQISVMQIDHKKVMKDIDVFGSFIQTLAQSFVSFGAITAIFRKYPAHEILENVDIMDKIINSTFKIFGDFLQYKGSYKTVYNSLLGFEVLFDNIPSIIEKIVELADYIKVNKLNAKVKEVTKIMTPVMALILLMTPKYSPKFSEITKLKIGYNAILNGVNNIITSLNKLDDNKIKDGLKKIKSVTILYDSIFTIFQKIKLNAPLINIANKSVAQLALISKSTFKMALMFSIVAPMVPIALIGITFIVTSINVLKKAATGVTKLLKFAGILAAISGSLILYATSLLVSSLIMVKTDWTTMLVGIAMMFVIKEAFQQMGKNVGKMLLGSLALTVMSVALVAFGIGLLLYSLTIKAVGIGDALLGAVVLLAYGVVFTALGFAVTSLTGAPFLGSLAAIAMGIGLAAFSIGLIVMAGALKISDSGSLLMGSVVLLAYGVAFTIIGIGVTALAGAPILGAITAIAMGIGLAAFGIGLIFFGLALKTSDIGSLLMGSVVLLAFGISFSILGVLSPLVILGSIATLLMSASLIVAGIGFGIFGAAVSQFEPKTLLIGGLILLGFGIVYSILGLLSLPIIAGSIAAILMGISLPIFAVGLTSLSLLPKIDPVQMLVVGLTMAVLGIGYSILGVLSPFIVLGVVAIVAISISLPLFIGALAIFNTLPPLNIGNMLKVGLMMGILGVGYAALGLLSILIAPGILSIVGISMSLPFFVKSLSSLELLQKVRWKDILEFGGIMTIITAGYVALGAVAPIVLIGTFAMAGMASSIRLITAALKESMTFDWTKVPIDDIKRVMIGLATAFATVGADGNTGIGGFITGILNTVGIGPNNVRRGIETVMEASKSLTSISSGLKVFNDSIQKLDLSVDANGTAKAGSFLERMKMSIMAVSETFGAMGAKYPSKSFFGLWTIDKSSIQKGIDATMESGKALESVADGLLKFDEKTRNLFGPDKGVGILDNIRKTIGMIQAAFSEIGKGSDSGFLGLGIFTSTDVEKGIESVEGVGKIFVEIAEGLKVWSDLDKSGIKTSNISDNIKKVLSLISEQFSSIGKGSTSGGFLGFGATNDVEKGIDSVKGIGKVFKEIAEGLKAFSDLEKMGFKPDSFNPNTRGSIAANMLQVLTSTSKLFQSIGERGKEIETTDAYGNKIKKWVPDDSVKRGIDAVKGVGDILSGIGKGLKDFADIDSMKLPIIRQNITDILSTVASVFGQIGSGQISLAKMEDVKAGVKAVEGVGKELESISKSLMPYMDLQKDKKLDINALKKNIKDIVSTTLMMMGAIGVIQGSDNNQKSFLIQEFGPNYSVMKTENIKTGVDALKSGNGGIEFIQKAAEILKSVNDQKDKLNFSSINDYIKNVIVSSLSILGAIGVTQSTDGKYKAVAESYFGSNYWLLNNYWIEKGKEVLSKSYDSLKEVIKLASELNKNSLDVKDFSSKKQIISDIVKLPIEAIGQIIQQYKYENIQKWLVDFVPLLGSKINYLLNLADREYKGTIGILTGDLKSFLKDVVNAKIDKKQMDSMDKIVQFFERWSKIDDPFAKFTKTFAKHLSDFKEYVKEINNIDTTKMQSYNDMNYRITEMIKTDPNQLMSNTDNIKKLVIQLANPSQKNDSELEVIKNNQKMLNDIYNRITINNQPQQNIITEKRIEEKNTQDTVLLNTINDNLIGLRSDTRNLTSLFKSGEAMVATKNRGR